MSVPPAVILVEDDLDQVRNLEDLFGSFGLATASYTSAEALLTYLPREVRGCLVLDLRLRDSSGLVVLQTLRQRGQWLPAVIISGQATVGETVRMFELGVHRFFQKPIDPPVLVQAVYEALAEDEQHRQVQMCQQRLAALSRREREVLEGLMADKTLRQIARELGISVSTVEKHRAKILSKVGVDSLVGLAGLYYAARRRVLPRPHLGFGGSPAAGPVVPGPSQEYCRS